MTIRLLLALAIAVTFAPSEPLAHDGVHKTRPSPFRECKYTVETVSSDVRGGRSHHHHYDTHERCWITDETYIILGLGAALAVVLALSFGHRRYYASEEAGGFTFMPEPSVDIQKKQLGMRFNLNW